MRGGNVTQTAKILNRTKGTRSCPRRRFANSGGKTNSVATEGKDKNSSGLILCREYVICPVFEYMSCPVWQRSI